MSKAKKKASSNANVYSYDEYKERYGSTGTGGHVYSYDEYIKRENQLKENRRKAQEQAEQAERAKRIIGNYKMQKANPAPFAPGGKADRLVQTGKSFANAREETEKEQKKADFRDWSMVDNLLNPKSKVNEQIAKRPQAEQKYWGQVRQNVSDALNNPRGSMTRADQLLKATTGNVAQKKQKNMDAMMRAAQEGASDPVKNTRDYIYEYNTNRDNGQYTGNDLKRMSEAQLEQYVTQNRQALDEAKRKNENLAQQKAESEAFDKEEEKYRIVADHGLPMVLDYWGEAQPMGSEEWNKSNEINYTYLQGRPEDYEGNTDLYDRAIYDWFHGNGAYQERLDNATDEEWEVVSEEVNDLWNKLESGEMKQIAAGMWDEKYQKRTDYMNENNAGEYEQNIRAGEAELENRGKIRELEENAPEGYWKYDPEKVNYNINLQTGKTDQIYYYANMDLSAEDLTDFRKYGNLRPAQFMTDEQLNTFNGYYLNGQYDEAQAYYDGLEPYLQQMKSEYQTVLEQQMYNNGWAIPMTGIRIATKPVEGVVGMIGTGAALLGNEEWRNKDSDVWGLSRTNMNIQNTSAEAWGKQFAEWFGGGDEGFAAQAGRFLNGVMFSIADNITAFALSGGAGALNEAGAEKIASGLIQFVMSSEATASTMYEKINEGMDPTQAAFMAYGNGIIEAITEKYSLEQILDPNVRELLGTKGAFLRYLGKSALAEGSEEIASDLLDTGLDYVMSAIYGNKAELTRKYDDLLEGGMEPGEATRTVILEYMEQLGQSGMAGALSGLLMSGSRGVNTRINVSRQNAQLATKAMQSGVDTETDTKVQKGQQAANLFKIIETGEGFRAGTETNALAKQIREEIRGGKNVDKAKVGQLVRTIVNESSDVVSNTMRSVLGDAFTEELNRAGIERNYAENLKGALTDIIVDGNFDARSMQLIAGSPAAQKILAEFKMGGFQAQVQKAQELTQQESEAKQSVMEMIAEPKSSGVSADQTEAKMDGAEWLKKGDAELEQAQGKATGKAGEVVADGMIGTVVGFGTKTENGQTFATAMVEAAGKTTEVDLSDVQATNEATAKVLQFMQNEAGQCIGSNLGAAVMKIATAKNAAGVMSDAVNLMISDLTGTAAKVSTLNKAQQQAIRAAIEQDNAEADEQAAQNKKELTPGQGKITYDGTTYGTKEFSEKLNGLGKGIRDEAEYVARLMKSAGMNVDFYYNAEESANQGAFYGGEGIRINLAGTYNAQGVHRSIVATVGHEATHWLRANSPAAYRQMQKYVMQVQQKNGTDLQVALRHIMDNYAQYGEHLTMDKAAEELVAMSCEQIFTNEKLVNELQAEDPGLYGKMKQAVMRIVNRLREAITGNAQATSSRYAKRIQGTLDELGRVWKIAYEAAKGAEEAGEGTRVANSRQMDDLDQQYADAVKRGDWRTAEDMLLEKMQQTEGITGYRAPHFYAGEHKDIARLIKSGDQDVINSIVEDMAQHVQDNAVLVPMPPHEGKVTDSTDTMILAKALSKATGAQVINALESDYHESRYKAKAAGDRSVNAQTMGFRQVAEIPDGMMPVFIDNMVGGGQTAMAAKNAIGRGITLAYAQSSRSKSLGVKAVSVTYDQDGKLIPLSQRMDPNNKSWKYSIRDDRYMDVVNDGDMETAQWMVDQMAEDMLEDSKVRGADGKLLKMYHGTKADFNEFRREFIGSTGRFEGSGFNFTPYEGRAKSYGGNVLAGYLNIRNPLSAEKKTISVAKLAQIIREADPTGDNIISDYARETRDYGTEAFIRRESMTAARNIWESSDNDVDIYSYISAADRDAEGLIAKFEELGYDGLIHYDDNGKIKTAIAFNSNQFKRADPVTRDNDGKIIPLSERFNTEKKDIRWSMRDDTDYDVRQWMETVPEWSLKTEAEKELLRNYGGLQMKQRLDRERMRKIDRDLLNLEAQLTEERTGRVEAQESMDNALESAGVSVKDGHWLQKNGVIIGKIEADGTITMNKGAKESDIQALRAAGFGFTNKKGTFRPGGMSAPTQDGKASIQVLLGKSEAMRQREALQKKRDALQKSMDQTEEKLQKILGDEGFGKMMYQQQKVLENLESFTSHQELVDYVGRMEKAAQAVAARIEENRKAADALAKSDTVKKLRELLGTTTAEQTAAELKKEYSSTWTKNQIRAYLDPIILKMKSGQDFTADVETLAGILVGSDSRNKYETLEDLRGLTITLGKGAQAELKAQNSSLKEVRARLAGTGITVKYGDRSTLEADIEDLRAEYPMIPELGDEKDALGNFLNWIDSMKSVSAGMEFYDQRIAEAMALITQKAAGAAKGIYMPNDPKAQKQVLAMMDFVKGLNAETAAVQKTLADVAAQMAEMQKAGMGATNRATTMMRDVNVAIDYYQKIGKIAADEAKQNKVSAQIEQLKSKHAEEIVKNNAEWRAQIQRDADSRKQLEENRKYQKQVNTNLKRMWKLLKEPKGLNNIPEYMQGLAREVISMFVNNDMGRGSRFLQATMEELADRRRILDAWDARDGKFDRSELNVMDPTNVKADVLLADVDKITEALKVLNSYQIYGKNKLDALQQRGAIIGEIRDAVSEIYSAIKAEQEVQMGDRRVAIEDAAYAVAQGTGGKTYREWTGAAGQKMAMLHRFIVSGNMTPEYYFRTLGNAGLTDLWENYHIAENRNGLELKKSQEALAKIAEEYGYKNWDMKQKITLNLESGDVTITLGQLMSLWATWKREQTLGPEMSEHLTRGGFFADVDLRDGLLGRATVEKRAHRVTEEDMEKAKGMLTEEQRKFVDAVVGYMSRDMSELGNEASMKAYGIKLYKESYYFPFQMWDGVKTRKSNDAGSAAGSQDRAFHPSFSKSRVHGANNAVMIGDFMQVATDHIAGMINYATMGLANESLNKVLNQQTTSGGEYETKRNTRAILEEAYGRDALKYLMDLKVQLEGGAVKTERSIGDKAISLFRKNAVAGSLSVALQQPLSYIRAAMMINPKYLTQAVMKEYWKGSYKELMEHSGVAVIKDMGRFDMNAGASAREYLMPDGKESTGRMVWNAIGEYSTILPEKMDAWTWTRMWVAVKAEQHAEHPEMNMKSDEFLDMCGKRFNDIMRRTQVYDSTLVRSANMRSTNYFMKGITSFMAEPTLTINCLADAVRMAAQHEKGGATMLWKAGVTFMLSAIMQAAVKGIMGAGRNPDEKKTLAENFLYRFMMNLTGEANPLSLIPGYGDLVTLLKKGELSDDAMGAIGKIWTAGKGTISLVLNGAGDKGLERELEDTVGQLMQIFTNIPAKNLMRDTRAIANFITQPYAKRENSWAVIKYQTEQARQNTDTLMSWAMQEAGFKTTNAAYYERIYQAKKDGREQDAADMIEYLLKGKGVKQEAIASGIAGAAKKDGNASAEDTANFLIAEGGNAEDYIKDQMRDGKLDAEAARELLQKANPEKDADSIWWTVDRIQYQLETGAEKAPGGSSYYYRLKDAIDEGKSEGIRNAVKGLLEHGIEKERIKDWIGKKDTGFKPAYLAATGNEKVKIKNALIMAYKAIGIGEKEANEIINKWAKDSKKKN